VIFAVDTSSARSALALLDEAGEVVREELHLSGPSFQLPARFREIAGAARLTRVAVATGPGSFTGLRVGVSFGLGLAIGLKIPIVPLATLAIQAARSDDAVLAVSEAGRGRVYFLSPAGEPGLAEPGALPTGHPVAGWLRPATESALAAAGLRLESEAELRSFGAAVARLLKSARDVPYGSVKLEYMQSFGIPTKSEPSA
jgi:tRNA threonylcarbamoyladenosine biosynthesis protein TsaB